MYASHELDAVYEVYFVPKEILKLSLKFNFKLKIYF